MFSLSELHLLRTSSTLLTSNFANIYSALDAFIHMYVPTYSLLRIHTKQLNNTATQMTSTMSTNGVRNKNALSASPKARACQRNRSTSLLMAVRPCTCPASAPTDSIRLSLLRTLHPNPPRGRVQTPQKRYTS